MRVKYSNQKQIISCSNEDFKLSLNVRFYEQDSGQQLFLFDPVDVFNFISVEFFDQKRNYKDENKHFNLFLRTFLYQGCSLTLENKSFVNATGLKHFFSSLVSSLLVKDESHIFLDWKQSKFLNWFLNFDFNSAILRAKGLNTDDNLCKFCNMNDLDVDDSETFYSKNADMIREWVEKVDSKL